MPEIGHEYQDKLQAARRRVEEAIQNTGAPPDLPGLRRPEEYLGVAEEFRRRLLEGDK